MSKIKSMALQCVGVFSMFLFVWWWVDREHIKVYPEPVKVYQGTWIEDTKKIGDWWSVGYLQREGIK